MSSLQPRDTRPSTRRAVSSAALAHPGSSAASSAHKVPTPAQLRRRSHSLYNPAAAPTRRVSTLFDSLDLPTSLLGLREYLARKLENAERSLQALKAFVDEEVSELETEGETEGDDGGATSAGETEDEHDGSERDEVEGRSLLPHGREYLRDRSASPGADDDLRDEISALQAFISNASSFLAAMRAELPSLASASDAACLQFQLSPDARMALDHFLEDHPLPSLPHFGLRSRAASSANAILERVSTEMRGAYDALSYAASTADPASYFPYSFRSSLPSTPSLSDFSDLRAYFSAESTRLSNAVSQLKDDTTGSLSAGLHHALDGAAELSAYVKGEASHALDEARRMYHVALEIGKTRLLRYEELPPDWRNNEHILTGYRYIPIEEWGALLRSAWQWHNETINIQSHFLGFLSLVVLLVYYLFFSSSSPHVLADPHPGDTAIAVLFVISAMHCLLCSTTWHLFAGCATSHWHRSAACVDYVGISGLIAASVAGSTYYGFYEHPQLAMGYMMFNLIVGVTGMIVPWAKWFNEREYKGWRVAFFCSLAASAVAPVTHRAMIYGLRPSLWFYSPVIPSVAAYLIGLSFYANQFPECYAPGAWHIGASHQLWHVAILAAVWLHWKAMGDWSATVALASVGGAH
ncbi:inc metabolism membrane protein [Rhodotorula kratochvilovae]